MKKDFLYATLCLAIFFFGCKKEADENLQKNTLLEDTSESVMNKKTDATSRLVRVIYIIPSDRSFNKSYFSAVKKAASNLQRWYRDQMSGKTFQLNKPVVETLQSDKTAAWFSANNGTISGSNSQYYFFWNSSTEAQRLLGSEWDVSKYRFTIYVDAFGQTGAGITGYCIMPENDLKGLSGLMPEEPVNRWIGGWGHELGHAFGLPHPDGSPYWNEAIMGTGYLLYPNCFLLEEDKTLLLSTGFFN